MQKKAAIDFIFRQLEQQAITEEEKKELVCDVRVSRDVTIQDLE
jgi:hypothetical protein